MADFSLRDLWWLKPKEQDNPLPALRLGVNIAQHRAKMDLAERDLANDIARTSLMREEMLAKQKIQTMLVAGNAEMASAISEVDDWTDDEQVSRVWAVGARNPMTVGSKAWLGAQHMHESARTAKRLETEAQSRIAERDRKAAMADNMGWVYPEDGSPPYLVDAKGGTRFAPFRAGLDDNFTPEETKIGDVTLIRTSPNRWQVVNKSIPAGRMTDLEKINLGEIRKQRQALVDSIGSEAPTLKTGLFGGSGNKAAVDKYKAQADKIAELTAKESSLIQAVEARDKPDAAEIQGPPYRPVQREGLRTEDRTTNAPPAVVAPAAPMPSTKADLVKDQIYQTPRGRAKWDGEKFIPQ